MSLETTLTEEQRMRAADQRAALEADVERLKNRPNREVSAPPVSLTDNFALSVADVMPEMIEAMERQREKWAAFCDTIRPQFAEAPETKACDQHHAVRRPKLFEESCQRSRQKGEYRTVYAPCPECTGEEARTAQRAFWRRRGVPERVVDSTLANFTTDTEEKVVAVGKVREWIKRNGIFLLLRGTPGTGKGHLASGCLKAHGNGLWITQADMLKDLRASYTLHTTTSLIEDWRNAEVFVLDEFGLSPGGGDEESMLYQVLADRYDKRRPTVITTNLDREKFKETIGFRLMDRIGEDCVVVQCIWESHRRLSAERKPRT